VSQLLHPAFEEIGRSGRRYDRAAVLRAVASAGGIVNIRADDFALAEIADGVALLTYRSAHVDSIGRIRRRTLRSSLWVRTAAGWQLRFHQGTAIDT
jgi:hypothetical protein